MTSSTHNDIINIRHSFILMAPPLLILMHNVRHNSINWILHNQKQLHIRDCLLESLQVDCYCCCVRRVVYYSGCLDYHCLVRSSKGHLILEKKNSKSIWVRDEENGCVLKPNDMHSIFSQICPYLHAWWHAIQSRVQYILIQFPRGLIFIICSPYNIPNPAHTNHQNPKTLFQF